MQWWVRLLPHWSALKQCEQKGVWRWWVWLGERCSFWKLPSHECEDILFHLKHERGNILQHTSLGSDSTFIYLTCILDIKRRWFLSEGSSIRLTKFWAFGSFSKLNQWNERTFLSIVLIYISNESSCSENHVDTYFQFFIIEIQRFLTKFWALTIVHKSFIEL